MLQHLLRRGTRRRTILEHWQQKITEFERVSRVKMILLAHHAQERPVFQVGNVAQLAFAIEIVVGVFARQRKRLWYGTEQFYHQC